jgi:hypothetical protein
MQTLIPAIAAALLFFGWVTESWSDDKAFFEARIRPLLVDRCYECHSAARKEEGGLRLDLRSGWQLGGESGPAIAPGSPDKSLLIQRVRGVGDDSIMPPRNAGKPLTEQQIADLEAWVRGGAFDPRDAPLPGVAAKKDWETTFHERLDWWSLKPVQAIAAPEVADAEWSRTAVDRFLRDAMERGNISPSPAADRSTLLRRASLVLTGLPPNSELAEEYHRVAAEDPEKAYERLVDQLLESPQFGERFARHWLDVVRFSETHGNEWNYDAAFAWRYRDYVIRAFNADVPYDRFVREHIAGDLLPDPRRSAGVAFNETPLGTAFYRFGEVNHDSCTQFPVIGYDILDNQVDTLTKAFQATTAACARCHDHKLDAISQQDYYSLLAVVRSSRPVMHTLDDPLAYRDTTEQLLELKRALRAELANVWRSEANSLNTSRLDSLTDGTKDQPLPLESPLSIWHTVRQATPETIASTWTELAAKITSESAVREEFNTKNFELLADFRQQIPPGWHTDGHGLQRGVAASGDFLPATDGPAAIKTVLPAGLMTFSTSDRLNGALRSPNLRRTHGKISFEVLGGRFSLARLVFNSCQFNYDRQHSIHHDTWSWITIDWPDQTDVLNPYVELLTFWDNPKFPDPLGTLGKDIEVQREPFDVHAKNPRSWWGIRRIMRHDVSETPRASLSHLRRLLAGDVPQTPEALAAKYAAVAAEVVNRFEENRADDNDVTWLDWLIRAGLLSNSTEASPRLAELISRYREVEARLAPATTFPGLADESDPISQPVFARGDLQKPRETVPRGYMRMIAPQLAIAPSSSGRRELAEAIASPTNPLTARVMVNRIWQWVFGPGLVGTPDDFGHLGEVPLHPELLDYLAARFLAEGWSVKRLVRELVMTRAFGASGRSTESASRLDPQNLFYSHFPSRGAEAEVIRDSLLAVSGRIDLRMYGPSVHPFRTAADNEKRLFVGPLDGDGRRSIYIKFQLMEQPAFLRAFNLPGGKVTEGRRGSSHTVEQSLAMLNDPLVLLLADQWAGKLIQDGSGSVSDRLRAMFRKALSRDPSESELTRFTTAVQEFGQSRGIAQDALLSSQETWREVAHTVFNLQEFRFIP